MVRGLILAAVGVLRHPEESGHGSVDEDGIDEVLYVGGGRGVGEECRVSGRQSTTEASSQRCSSTTPHVRHRTRLQVGGCLRGRCRGLGHGNSEESADPHSLVQNSASCGSVRKRFEAEFVYTTTREPVLTP